MNNEIGRDMRHAMEELFGMMGDRILVHKNYGTADQRTTEVAGMKNNEKNRPEKVMFQFLDRVDVANGDHLQVKGARDVWRVTETEDDVQGGVFIMFEAKVQKVGSKVGHPRAGANVVVHGSVYGALQVDSPNAHQHVSVQIFKIDENVKKLRELLARAPIDELDREEAQQALDRVTQLAAKPSSPSVTAKIQEKLNLVKTTFEISSEVAAAAAPYFGAIIQALG